MVEIKKAHIIAAYLIATAFMMGAEAASQPYSCPEDRQWRPVVMTLFAGLVWPIGATAILLGWTPDATKCWNGAAYIEPPK